MFHLTFANAFKYASSLMALRALPTEAVLEDHIRSVIKAIVLAVIGGVLAGSAITGGLITMYKFMVVNGVEEVNALLYLFFIALILASLCFYLAARVLKSVFRPAKTKQTHIEAKLHYAKTVLDETLTGFMEGLLDPEPVRKRKYHKVTKIF